jgi:sugar lactone lactonase YvrE
MGKQLGGFVSAVASASMILLPATIACGQQRLITTIAGISPSVPQTGQPALAAPLINPHDVALDPQGRLVFSDEAQSMVIRIESDQTMVIVAGNGIPGISGDGDPAAGASLAGSLGLAFDGAGALYISDANNNRIRKVAVDGIITTVAGTGVAGSLGDGGPATEAQLNVPRGLAVDGNGNLYISDSANNRVRRISPDGLITTIAGTGAAGFSGDGGPATQATFYVPDGLAIDAAENLYVADYGNSRVRKIGPEGVISTVAGGGSNLTGGDGGPATSVVLRTTRGLALDGAGNLYISEDIRVRKVSPERDHHDRRGKRLRFCVLRRWRTRGQRGAQQHRRSHGEERRHGSDRR